jgi:hypothetical protein
MTHVTPIVSKKSKMEKNVSGPRAETLMMIRYFARVYESDKEQKQAVRKSLVN